MMWIFCSVVLLLIVYHRTFRRVMAGLTVLALLVGSTLVLTGRLPWPAWASQVLPVRVEASAPPTAPTGPRQTLEQQAATQRYFDELLRRYPPDVTPRTPADVAREARGRALEDHFATLSTRPPRPGGSR